LAPGRLLEEFALRARDFNRKQPLGAEARRVAAVAPSRGLLEPTGGPVRLRAMEAPDPPRKNYDFKEREFKRDNPVGSAVPPMPTTKELAMMAGPAAPKVPPGPATLNGGVNREADPNDVYTLLRHNRAVEQRGGLDEVEIKRVRSRRKRDFWVIVVPTDILLVWLTWVGRDNPVQFVVGLAGLVLVTVGLAWIMFQVMDRY